MKLITTCLLLAAAVAAQAQSSLEITTSATPEKPRPGQGVGIRSVYKNRLTPRTPMTVTATVSYIDYEGTIRTAGSSVQVQVVQPITLMEASVQLPVGVTFMENTAEVNGVVVTPTITPLGLMTIPINKTISEGELVEVLYGLKVP